MWYDYGKILSYKCDLNVIIGTRGHGKTYGGKIIGLTDYERFKRQFVYVRRYDTQLATAKSGYMTDISPDRRVKNIYSVNGDKLYACGTKEPAETTTSDTKPDPVAGHFIPLSRYETFKSTSYQDVYNIIFDEFITAERYLSNEVFKFADLCETILRHRRGRIFMLSNSLSLANPYFEAWGVKGLKAGFNRIADNIVIHYDCDEDFSAFKKSTTVGRLFGATSWGAYAYDNDFALDDPTNIGEPAGVKETLYNLVLNGREIGVYYVNGALYLGKPFDGQKYTPYIEDCCKNSDVKIVDKKDRHIYNIYSWCTQNKVLYADQSTKNAIMELLQKVRHNY